ncbi:MAG: hypothetical protein F6J93_00635 [Oscillatoria sp. SIO1A7]|nr:hypothetical protein [Oscillatoria sp. SIO1A7]
MDEIQSLITDIDGVMRKMNSRMAWWMSGDIRRVLERTRSYLVSLQKQSNASSAPSGARNSDRKALPSGTVEDATSAELEQNRLASTEDLRIALDKEMTLLRTNLMQPLLSEMEGLRQERESLVLEVRELELQRQNELSLTQQQARQQQFMSEFLQGFMGRLQERLTEQVAQAMVRLEGQLLKYESTPYTGAAYTGAAPLSGNMDAARQDVEALPPNHPLLDPAERLEHLRMLQAQSDRLLISLDSTLRVVFETMQRNLQAYEESLTEGLEKMHRLGQQGEVMFASLVSHLVQQSLGLKTNAEEKTASYLQGSLEPELLGLGAIAFADAGILENKLSRDTPGESSPTEEGKNSLIEEETRQVAEASQEPPSPLLQEETAPEANYSPDALPPIPENEESDLSGSDSLFPFAGTELRRSPLEESQQEALPVSDGAISDLDLDLDEALPENIENFLNSDEARPTEPRSQQEPIAESALGDETESAGLRSRDILEQELETYTFGQQEEGFGDEEAPASTLDINDELGILGLGSDLFGEEAELTSESVPTSEVSSVNSELPREAQNLELEIETSDSDVPDRAGRDNALAPRQDEGDIGELGESDDLFEGLQDPRQESDIAVGYDLGSQEDIGAPEQSTELSSSLDGLLFGDRNAVLESQEAVSPEGLSDLEGENPSEDISENPSENPSEDLFGDMGNAQANPVEDTPTTDDYSPGSSPDNSSPDSSPDNSSPDSSPDNSSPDSSPDNSREDLFGEMGNAQANPVEDTPTKDERPLLIDDLAIDDLDLSPDWEEDRLKVSPDEDLIGADESQNQKDLEIEDSTVQQLNEDLFGFEESVTQESSVPASGSEDFDDLSLFTLQPQTIASTPPVLSGQADGIAAMSPSSVEETVDDDDIFANLTAESNSLPSDSSGEELTADSDRNIYPENPMAPEKATSEIVTIDNILADLIEASPTADEAPATAANSKLKDELPEPVKTIKPQAPALPQPTASQNTTVDDFFDSFGEAPVSKQSPSSSENMSGLDMSDLLTEPTDTLGSLLEDEGSTTLDDFFASLQDDKTPKDS